MNLQVASLNSGSNGNCYYVGYAQAGVLIDVGIAASEVEKRLTQLHISIQSIKATFITHEHGDHIHGLPAFAKKYNLPVYLSKGTYDQSEVNLNKLNLQFIKPYHCIEIDALKIVAFPKQHDAAEAFSFYVEKNNIRVGVITDIGLACSHVQDVFANVHACILESNYDEEMLENGRYPLALKRRIRGGLGHLSNKQAKRLFLDKKHKELNLLLLAHLSKNNNKPELALAEFEDVKGSVRVDVLSRYKVGSLYDVTGKPFVFNPAQAAKFVQQLTVF
jgi:phosphoribosyl 1,2-cyclic phosphodiesterase